MYETCYIDSLLLSHYYDINVIVKAIGHEYVHMLRFIIWTTRAYISQTRFIHFDENEES